MQLPIENNVDIPSLSSIFGTRTNSYKFLFFQALLLLIKDEKFKKYTFSFSELEVKMLDIAEYPINVFKLNFGTQDQVTKKMFGGKADLVKYVPYRLLTSFFQNELSGLLDAKKNKKIEELSNSDREFNSIYKINDQSIEIYSEWMQYFLLHYSIIESWAFWHWVNFLQGKNPNAMALVNKLQKPSKRASLNRQTKYWKAVLERRKLNCIFSNKPIEEVDFSLDHFLPWSFIGHDQLWNLIPISRSVNSSKSDNIPSMEKYLDGFIEQQIMGLEVSAEVMTDKAWKNHTDDFIVGLNVGFEDLTNNQKILTNKYQDHLEPLADMASNMGFNSKWVYVSQEKSSNICSKEIFTPENFTEEEYIVNDNEVLTFENSVPLFSLKAAAGEFREWNAEESHKRIKVPNGIKMSADMFACRVIGESMNKVIPNDSYCLFRKSVGGTRYGQIVLAENMNKWGDDSDLYYTVKYYESEKHEVDGVPMHKSIILKPNSTDDSYENIVLNPDEDMYNFTIIGIFIQVLDNPSNRFK